jgi:hypothetical protein
MYVWAGGHGPPEANDHRTPDVGSRPRNADQRNLSTEERPVQLPQLKRIRWAVRAALILGVAASVAANVLHALPNPISQAISAWPPLALLLTVELTSRIPMHKRSLAAVRILATMAIACIAAWVSYWHMKDVAHNYGESTISAYLLPVSVDGLIVVASVSLVELAGRIRMLEDRRANAAATATAPAVTVAPMAAPVTVAPAPVAPVPVAPAPVAIAQPVPAAQPEHVAPARPMHSPALAQGGPVSTAHPVGATITQSGPVSMGPRQPVSPLSGKPLAQSAPVSPAVGSSRPAPVYVNGSTPPPARPTVTRAAVSTTGRTIVTSPTTRPTESSAPKQRRPVQETAELAEQIEAMHPEISQNELAKQLGISATRLRAVRREARDVRRSTGARR